MTDGQIRIIIGASADRSINTVFGDIENRAKKTAQAINKSFSGALGGNASGSGVEKSFDRMGKAADKAANDALKAVDRQKKETDKAVKEMERDWDKSQKEKVRAAAKADKEIIKGFKEAVRERSKALKQQQHEEDRAQAKADRNTERFATRASRYALRDMAGAARGAMRVGGDLLRGAGVETSISGLVSRTVGIESAAVGLSNRGHIEGAAGPNGGVVSSKLLENEARKTGLATAVNPEELLSAGRAFVGLTGDLDLWRKIMPTIAKQTAALGGNQEDAAKAAGEFATHLGDVKDKDQAIEHLMAVAAGQGKIGGVDFSDFAKYASRAAAPAGSFAGDKAQNIGKLTGLAEITKVHGGATSAAEAFQGVTSFVNALKKPARLKSISALLGNGESQFVKGSNNSTLRDVNQVIKDIIWAAAKDAKGNHGLASLVAATKAVGDVRAMKPINGLMQTFNAAGGGKLGMDAVTEELKKFDGAVMSSTEIERANAAQMETSRAQAEVFNQALESVTHGMMAELGPSMKELAPHAIQLAGAFGHLVTWAANNPMPAVGVAIAAAITKGGVEAAFRSSMERLLESSASAAVAIGGLAVVAVAAAVAMHLIDSDTAARAADQRQDALNNAHAGELEATAYGHAKSGKGTADDSRNLESIDNNLEQRIANVRQLNEGKWGKFDRNAGDAELLKESIFQPDKSAARQDNAHIGELKDELERNRRVLDMIRTTTLNVNIMNPESISFKGPAVPPGGRAPNPGLPKSWD